MPDIFIVVQLCEVVFSWLSSALMVGIYFSQKSRAPRLLLWLFVGNLCWFSCLLIIFFRYLYSSSDHKPFCKILTTFEYFSLLFSMLWPSIICFDLHQNTLDPKWESQRKELYYILIVVLASGSGAGVVFWNYDQTEKDLGCNVSQYSRVATTTLDNLILEFYLPLVFLAFNVVYLVRIRRNLGRELPFSVRSRRCRQLHMYVFSWILCWGWFVVNAYFDGYVPGIKRGAKDTIFIVRNIFLYMTGFICLVAHGWHNAWLKRGLIIIFTPTDTEYLRARKEKIVKFCPHTPHLHRSRSSLTHGISSSKHYVLNCRLTEEDKAHLYMLRPDLDMSRPHDGDSQWEDDMESQHFGVIRQGSSEDEKYSHEGANSDHTYSFWTFDDTSPQIAPYLPQSSEDGVSEIFGAPDDITAAHPDGEPNDAFPSPRNVTGVIGLHTPLLMDE